MSIPMSIDQKRNLDAIFKLFIAAAIAFFGWLGNRTIQQFDAIKSAVENIREDNREMRTDIQWLKQELNKPK